MERLLKDAEKIQKANGKMVTYSIDNFADMVDAIHVVQTEMGITGTTADEAATTIQGSMASAGAAWENFLTGMADPAADMGHLIDNLVDSVLTAANNLVPAISRMLPNLVSGLTKLVVELSPTLLEMASDLVFEFAGAILDSLPVLIQTLGDLAARIIAKIPDFVAELVEAIPGIVDALGRALVACVPTLLEAVGDLVDPAAWALRAKVDELNEAVGGMTSFRDAIQNAVATPIDFSRLVSKSGHTLDDLNTAINEKEGLITETISARLAEQQELRDEDIENIREYQQQIQALEDEKLQIYQQQQWAEVTKTQLDMANMTYEEAAQHMANANELLREANQAAEDAYTSQLTTIESFYASTGEVGSEAYNAEIEAAKAHYDQMVEENTGYYAQVAELVSKSATDWVSVDADKWAQLAATTDEYSTSIYNTATGAIMGTSVSFKGNVDQMKSDYADSLSQMDLDTANAFLSMYATTVANGGEVSEEATQLATDMLNAFEDLPDDFDEIGKNTLLGMISGLEDQFPELADTGEMTADEVAKATRKALGIESPSKVFKEIGGYSTEGFVKGIEGEKASVTSRVKGFFSGIVNSVKGALGIHSPSKVFSDIGFQIDAGLAQGVDRGADEAEDSVQTMLRDIVGTATINIPDVAMLETGLTATLSADRKIYIYNNLTGSVEMDGYTVGTIVLRNLDDAAAYTLRGV